MAVVAAMAGSSETIGYRFLKDLYLYLKHKRKYMKELDKNYAKLTNGIDALHAQRRTMEDMLTRNRLKMEKVKEDIRKIEVKCKRAQKLEEQVENLQIGNQQQARRHPTGKPGFFTLTKLNKDIVKLTGEVAKLREKVNAENLMTEIIPVEMGFETTMSASTSTSTSMLQPSNEAVTKTAIKIELVSIEEAWRLFEEQVSGVLDSPNIMKIAQEIVEECDGLPLTIIATGKALRNENDVLVWEHALRQFQHLSKLTDEHEAAFRQLEFSYDRLKDRDIKRCFLHCALFAEDHEIKVDRLIENFIEEDLIHGISSRARKKGQDIIKSLIDSSLLDSVNGGLSLRIPSVVKDLGLWIMSSKIDDYQYFIRTGVQIKKSLKEEPYQGSTTEGVILSVAGAGLTSPPPKESWEGKKMIFLMNNDFSRLPKEPNCRNLLALFLQNNRRLGSIPDTFFSGMPFLRVLNLSKTGIRSLPPSLCELTELRALILRHCESLAELPPEVGNLGALEVLDIEGTELNNLPDEVRKLGSLRHLQVTFYESVEPTEPVNVPPYMVSRGTVSELVALQELHIFVPRAVWRWDENVEDITRDVSRLNQLTSLQLHFPNLDVLDKFIGKSQPWINNSLSKFNFIVGQIPKHTISQVPEDIELDYDQHDRCLRFVNGVNIPNTVLEVLGRATAFYLSRHYMIKSLSEFGITNIKELRFCIVSECPNILAVIDCRDNSESALQYLEHLSIQYLWNLESIFRGPLPRGSFNGLKVLSVHKCPKLDIILDESMLQCLSNLEELVVEWCVSLRKIIEMGEKTENENFVILPSLRKLSLDDLPQLISVWNGFRPSMEILLSIVCCPKLEISAHDAFEI
ncbi:probable disease resistance protein At4g27220 [Cornus florida]|uniref:probable disease resistance protein At4g27220 n=1 Tax=Cornus florida TaxID=4283 RepID=UPI00289A4E33|nr:probable disease resistance protein At4g27220 [Cornus florida]